MERIFSEITQKLAIKGLRAASQFDNIVFSPYALTSQLFSIIPLLDNMAKGRISRFFGLTEKLKNPAEFLRLWEIINLQENNCLAMNQYFWPDEEHQEDFSKAGIPFSNILANESGCSFTAMVNSNIANTRVLSIHDQWENLAYYKFASISAFSISASWKYQFYKELSNNSRITYHGDQGDIHSLPGLQRAAIYRSHIDSSYKLLDIPFADGDNGQSNLSLLILSPRYRKLREFELRFTADFINRAIGKMIDQERTFSMPAFQVENTVSLVDLFSGDKDLHTVFETGFLPGLLLHQVSLKVGDAGVEQIPVDFPSNKYDGPAELPSSIFFYDSPFTFWIRDRVTGVIFVAGRFVTP